MDEEPVVGAMYEDEDGLAFEVLSFDEDEGIIEVQYEDGEVSEIDIDTWYEMDLQRLKSESWKDSDEDDGEDVGERPGKRKVARDDEDEDDDLDDYDDDSDDY
ncbi:MAG TPA: DUF6763 family protein [Burkholderiales bacterium]